MLMVFLFHCARFFGGGGWHLKNSGEESLIATLFIGILDLWIMPLFFLLSGAGSWYALAVQNPRAVSPGENQAHSDSTVWGEPFSVMYVLFNATMSIAGWSWVAFMLSLGSKYLNAKNKLVTYGNEAVLPFYIFHQTIILCVGWFVIRWNMDILSKYLIIAMISFILIIVLYEVLVRPFNLMRFFFGMRPKRRPAAQPAASPERFAT